MHPNARTRWIAALLMLAALAATAALAEKPDTLVRDEIPQQYKWDFSDIYPGWDAWEADLATLETTMDEFAALKGKLGEKPGNLARLLQLEDMMGEMGVKALKYAYFHTQIDARDNDASARMQRVQTLFARYSTATAWSGPEVLEIPQDRVMAWIDATPELADYRFSLTDLFRQQEHVLDEDKETLLSYFGPFNGTPRTIYQQLSTADIDFPEVELSTGETLMMTPGNYYLTLTTNRNQDDRRKAFEAHYGVYNADANTYAAIYNAVLQRNWAQAQARGYASTLDAALDGNAIPTSVYENLVETVRENCAPMHRYYELRKRALGLETYHGYDGSASLLDFDKTYPFDEIVDPIIASVAPLGDEYQQKMRRIFSGGWIDVYENEGKRSGAFSSNIYGVHPYILMNYNETLSNFFTMAHEAGHAMHSVLSNENQPYVNHGYTIFVAEVASTLNEALLLDWLLDRTDDPAERTALLISAIEDISGTFFTQVMFADFEWRAHKMVEAGEPITADALRALYTELWKDYQGPAVTFDEQYRDTWARISHFYTAPYYVYQYSTCYASSAVLAAQIIEGDDDEREDAVARMLTLLKSGGNDHPMKQLQKAGVDLSTPAAFEAVIAKTDKLVSQLEEELKKLGRL